MRSASPSHLLLRRWCGNTRCTTAAPTTVSSRFRAMASTPMQRTRREVEFPSSTPFPAAATAAAGSSSATRQPPGEAASPAMEAEDLFEQMHHKASTEEPVRSQRTAADSQLWSPIVNRRIDGGGGGGDGERERGGPTASSTRDGSSSGGGGRFQGSSTSASSAPSQAAQRQQAEPSRWTNGPVRFSTMHRPFMGTSTRFRNPHLGGNVSITRADLVNLEKEFLSHSPPGRINDHLCIAMTRLFRWVADRAFRERYIHRATMLTTVAMAAPAAGSVAAYLRMMLAPRRRFDMAPFVHPEAASGVVGLGGAPPGPFSERNDPNNTTGSPSVPAGSGPAAGASPAAAAAGITKKCNNYADELRGLFTQSECHAVHYQILLSMAEITPLERGLVLVLQALQFSFFLPLFLLYPRMGFRLMGYMAEESSVVWTQMINDIDLGKIAEHHVPELALSYWGLQTRFTAQEALVPAVIPPKRSMAAALASDTEEDQQQQQQQQSMRIALPKYKKLQTRAQSEAVAAAAQQRRASLDGDRLTLRDVILLIRSDEMVYRDLNHRTADALDSGPREPGVIASYLLKRQQSR